MTSPDFARSRNYALWVPASAKEFFSETLAILKLLRPEERINQIAHDKERHDQSNKIFQSHDAPLKTIAATDIQACDYKKTQRDDNKYNVSHMIAPENRLLCKMAPQARCQPLHRERLVF
jgi:O-glycosyl hydrolase